MFLLGCAALPACEEGEGEHHDEVHAAVDACLPFAELATQCAEEDGEEEAESYYLQFVGYCVVSLGYAEVDGPDCRAAYEEYYACISTLDCNGVDDETDDPCAAEVDALDGACDFDDEFTEDSGDS
jgi:hypothetical protein